VGQSGRLGADCAPVAELDRARGPSHITFMALSRKKATTIALDPEDDRLLSRAARERGVSRSEFIRQHLAIVLEQYRRHPKPRSAGVVRALTERGDERELFGAGR
jgi:Ribbon-helix-helix protein, copG family